MGDNKAVSKARCLRDLAAALLQDATQCSDLAYRDTLLSKALARLHEARLLLDHMDAEANSDDAKQTTARMH